MSYSLFPVCWQSFFGGGAFRDDEGDVVVLLLRAEALDLVDGGGEDVDGSEGRVLLERGDEAVFAELFFGLVEGFGDSVGVEGEDVAGGELAVDGGGVPVFEEAEDGGGGLEMLDVAVVAEEDAGEMAAVGVTEAAGVVVVVGEEDGGVSAVDGVLVEEAIDGPEEELGFVAREGELAAEVGLEIGHEERGGDAFAGDVADDEAETLVSEGEEVVVVSADVAGLNADSGIVECVECGEGLREEAGLDLLCDLELLGGAALGLEFLGGDEALLLDLAGELVVADQFEDVAVDVLETGVGCAEERLLGRLMEADALSLPEFVGGIDVFRDEAYLCVATDEAVLFRAGFGCDEREDGLTVGRGDRDPAAVIGEGDVGEDAEAELPYVELEAAVLISNVDGGLEHSEVGAVSARALGLGFGEIVRGGGLLHELRSQAALSWRKGPGGGANAMEAMLLLGPSRDSMYGRLAGIRFCEGE